MRVVLDLDGTVLVGGDQHPRFAGFRNMEFSADSF
jgi:hypothetical protein